MYRERRVVTRGAFEESFSWFPVPNANGYAGIGLALLDKAPGAREYWMWTDESADRTTRIVRLGCRRYVLELRDLVGSVIHVGTPKTHAARSVPFPDFLVAQIDLAMAGKRQESLLFGDGSGHLIRPNSQDGWFAAAVRRAMAKDPTFGRVTPHDLRHTAASLAISAGANVKAVQRMLGHASAAMTLDTYADLFDDDLDSVAAALSRARMADLPPRNLS